MKKIALVLGVLFLLKANAWAVNGKDSNQYDIINEADYAVLLYDLKKSLIAQFGQNNPIDGEYRASFIIGNLNLLKIKENIIKIMKQENSSILKRNITSEKIKKLNNVFSQAINAYLPTVKSMELSDTLIYMYMQMPELYGKKGIENYPKAMLHNAENIAISRFDNRYWFTNIKSCIQTKYIKDTSNITDAITECSKDYKNVVSKETDTVLKQLEPYRKLYEELY